MARSVGNVDLTMGLVMCPVQMIGVIDSHDRKGSQYHSHDDGTFGKVRMPKTCEDCGAVLTNAEISKGYEENGQVVVLSADELETVAANSGTGLQVTKFVKADQISSMLYADENVYRLIPDPKRGSQALAIYLTIRRKLIERGQVGVVQYTRWGRNRLAVLTVEDTEYGGVMVLRNIMWPDELRAPSFPVLEEADESKVDERLAPMFETVIESMTSDFVPAEFTDTYTEALNAAIEAKAAGGEVAAIAAAQGGGVDDISDLLAKLEASTVKAPAKKRGGKKAAAA